MLARGIAARVSETALLPLRCRRGRYSRGRRHSSAGDTCYRPAGLLFLARWSLWLPVL